MELERIKKVKLLVTLKGMAPDNSQQAIWHPGTVFEKPLPKNIIAELALNRPGVLEIIEFDEEPPSEPEVVETLTQEPVKPEEPEVPKKPEEKTEELDKEELLVDTQNDPPEKPVIKPKTKRKPLKPVK